jgi:hypothetical protein
VGNKNEAVIVQTPWTIFYWSLWRLVLLVLHLFPTVCYLGHSEEFAFSMQVCKESFNQIKRQAYDFNQTFRRKKNALCFLE